MDNQKGQFEVRSGINGEVFEDEAVNVKVNRDVRAIGDRSLSLGGGNEADKIDNAAVGETKMLTPAEVGLMASEETDVEPVSMDKIDYPAISNNRSDRLGKKAIEQIAKPENELKKDGNTEKFYDEVIEMKKALLKNNYGREIGGESV